LRQAERKSLLSAQLGRVSEESEGGGTGEGGDEEVTRGGDSRWIGAGEFVDAAQENSWTGASLFSTL
jgi:hypothetical protein